MNYPQAQATQEVQLTGSLGESPTSKAYLGRAPRHAMKVLVLAPPLAQVGGIQRYTQTMVRALERLLGDESVRCFAISETLDKNGQGGFRARAKLNFAFRAVCQVVQWRPTLIICTHLALGPIAWLVRNFANSPYWIVAHGIEAWVEPSEMKRVALRRADRVIVTSRFSRGQVSKRHDITDVRISSLPCTLDDTLFRAKPADTRFCGLFSRGQRLVLTVARMAASERYKGHDVVLRALPSVLAKIPNLTYVIVGDGDDRPRLEKLADDLGIAERVLFTGETSDSELAALYQRSELFAMPARTVLDDRNPKGEGFGIVYLEAMAFGKPVIGPDYGAPAELIQHGKTGLLVDPEDPTAVAQALLKLLSDPESAREMGRAGSKWVREHYSYDAFCDRLQEILTAGTE